MTGAGESGAPFVSGDGRFVLFASSANNLVSNSAGSSIPARFPARLNVYVRDRTAGTNVLVSGDFSGLAGGNADSVPMGISGDGRYVLFESTASNLVTNDTNGVADVFVRDLTTGALLLVSAGTNGAMANGASRGSVMTPDGRFVAFVSDASNLVPDDTNGVPDVFVRDLQTGTTTLASAGGTRAWPPANSGLFADMVTSLQISDDGRYVAFFSTLTNLVAGMTNVGDIFLCDLVAGSTLWVSHDARNQMQAALGAKSAVAYNPVMSGDGRFVAYEVSPLDWGPGAPMGLVLRYDRETDLTDLVATNASVLSRPYEETRSLDMTPDGQVIAYVGVIKALNGATNTLIYAWDAQTGDTTLVSADWNGQPPFAARCDLPTIDAAGRRVAFLSTATVLATNTVSADFHLFVRDLQAGKTVLVAAGTNSGGPGAGVADFQFSRDGRYIVFSGPYNWLPGDNNKQGCDVYVCELESGALELVSVIEPTLPCVSAAGSSSSSVRSLSSDGRYIAFSSDADNLAPNDTNGLRDVFVADTVTGTLKLVSEATNGWSGDGASFDPSISADGRFVAFTSTADNLAAGVTNRALNVFVRDLQNDSTALASVGIPGVSFFRSAYSSPVLSSDGRYVTFHCRAPGSANEYLLSRDLQLQTSYVLTCMTNTPAWGQVPSGVSLDGKHVAFLGTNSGLYVWDADAATAVFTGYTDSTITNIAISPDGNRIIYSAMRGMFAVDLLAHTNWTLSAALASPAYPSIHYGLRFSADGRFFAYASPFNRNLQDTNRNWDVYLYDLEGRSDVLISHSFLSSLAGNGRSDSPDISPDGRFVAFRSAATDLVPGLTNAAPDILMYDRIYGTVTLLTANRFGYPSIDSRSSTPVFSADGQMLVFESWASDLIAGDFNQSSDVFAYRIYSSAPIPLFQAQIRSAPGQGTWITWPTLPGKTYRVQFKNRLDELVWQDTQVGVAIVGNQGYFTDLSPAPVQRYYRVVAF